MNEVEITITTQEEAFELLINKEIPQYLYKFGNLYLSAITYDKYGNFVLIYKEDNNVERS